MTEQQETEFWKVVKIIQDCGLSTKWMVIGSWAELIYERAGLLSPDWSTSIRTLDLDFFIPFRSMKTNPADKPVPFARKMIELGFVLEEHRGTGISRFFSEMLEIEFLTELQGDGQTRSLVVGKRPLSTHATTGITPEPLRHLDILRRFPVFVRLYPDELNETDETSSKISVLVPDPKAYIVQKMVVNSKRGEKQEGDRVKIHALMQVMEEADFSEVLNALSKKELRAVEDFCMLNGVSFDAMKEGNKSPGAVYSQDGR